METDAIRDTNWQPDTADSILGEASPMDLPQDTFVHVYPTTLASLGTLQDQIDALETAFARQVQQCSKLNYVVTEITNMNDELYKYVGTLRNRIEALEDDNKNLRTQMNTQEQLAAKQGLGHNGNMGTNTLSLLVPNQGGLPTPMSPAAGMSLGVAPQTEGNDLYGSPPKTPGAGRKHTLPSIAIPSPNRLMGTFDSPYSPATPGGTRKSQTFIHKRGTHNLTKIMPPADLAIPMIPLTDTEVIVFFFNSLTRAVVSLRLYARNWGPAEITRVLNEHRDIRPDGYMRNTCSVKCTTAIKRGRDTNGLPWENHWREIFMNADDAEATDAIRHKEDEECDNQDYRVLDLLTCLKKFPVCNNPYQGAFGRAVEWCAQNEADIPMSRLHKVVLAQQHDLDPADALADPDSPANQVKVDFEVVESRGKGEAPARHLPAMVDPTATSALSEVDEELLALVESQERGMGHE